jgi:hypothetical protein
MFKIVHEEPEGIDQLPRLYPEELSAILRKMLLKDPQARYQRLDDVVRELEIAKVRLRVLEQKRSGGDEQAATLLSPESVQPESASQRLSVRRPVLLGGIGIAMIILAAAIWYLSSPSVPTGAIALNVLPWAEVARVERDSAGVVPLKRSYVTPCRMVLPAGNYTLTCTHPQYKRPLTLRVVIQKDSVLEVTQQWPGYDAAKILSQF